MKFKVGDKIRGISDEYCVTDKNMYLGEVTGVLTHGIKIKVLKHKDNSYVGKEYFAPDPDGKFEIVKNLTISQIQSEIDKLSNKVQKEYSKVISNRDKVNYLKEQLKELMKEESKKEENKPILDEKEKEYLKAVIRPFKGKVKYIKKYGDSRREYINIKIVNDSSITFPYFDKNTMYKGMKLYKEYTLKELGLDE